MRHKTADETSSNHPANENAEDADIHARLNRIIMANVVSVTDGGQSVRLRSLTYFETLSALCNLFTLTVAAYFYCWLMNKEA